MLSFSSHCPQKQKLKLLLSSWCKLFYSIHRIPTVRRNAALKNVTPSYSFHSVSFPNEKNHTLFYFALHLIKSATLRPGIESTLAIHCLTLKLGALPDLPTSTSLLIAYSRAGDFRSASAMFNEIAIKDVISFNAMLTGCIHNRCFGAAVDLFREMMMMGGSEFNSTTLLIVLSALSHTNDLKQGRVLHSLSLKVGMHSDDFLCNSLINIYAKCNDLSSSECMFAGMECRNTTSWNSIMNGCLRNGYPEKSLLYLEEMGFSGEQADNVTLSCAISASSCLKELGSGQVIHGLGIKLGYTETSYIKVANSLISFYSQCGDIKAAETVFGGIICKDVVSWNAMIDGYAANGNILEAFDLLFEMQLMGAVQPNSVTLITIIPLCAEINLLLEGKTAHGFTIRRGMKTDLVVTNSLVDMYSKCNSVKTAEILFKAIPERDLVSWNTMISGYSHNDLSKEAHNLFKEMLRWGPRCSLMTLLAILPSCDSPRALLFGKLIHSWQLKLGFSNNVLAVNAVIFMYINCGDHVASLSLLHQISIVADVASWNTVIGGYAQIGHFREALESFNLMRRRPHINHDSITLVSVLSACGNLQFVFQGRFLHGLALKTPMGSDIRVQNALMTMYSRCGDIESARSVFNSNPNCNLCSWNCMISGFSQNKDGKRALELFACLEFEPNEITLASILSACTQLGVLRHGRQIHGHVIRFGFHLNPFISATLVDMYSKCGRLDIAFRIFQNSPEKSVASWNSMISAYGFHSNSTKAIDLFSEMCKSGTKATKSTFISLLSACSHSGLVDEGLSYYDRMGEEFGVEPTTEHHVCMVDMLGRSGRLHEAYEFIKRIPTQPAPGVWGALLSACNYHGDLEMGRRVAEHLLGLEPENVGYYVSLSNMYVSAGRWSDVVEVRRIIQDKGLKKPPGYSLIDIGLG
ncbi:hypothetical protein HHK36_000556 [Tetracentron sinense]|uniref:Pentatricopeptide repeat-containing protein n=1 Tax=Tetracentron sinense TaxID=13715 RepID=A0A834ZUA5_TETSI|nr:hypothetical protein HHK36_000556 [Tetracentron sinense]